MKRNGLELRSKEMKLGSRHKQEGVKDSNESHEIILQIYIKMTWLSPFINQSYANFQTISTSMMDVRTKWFRVNYHASILFMKRLVTHPKIPFPCFCHIDKEVT